MERKTSLGWGGCSFCKAFWCLLVEVPYVFGTFRSCKLLHVDLLQQALSRSTGHCAHHGNGMFLFRRLGVRQGPQSITTLNTNPSSYIPTSNFQKTQSPFEAPNSSFFVVAEMGNSLPPHTLQIHKYFAKNPHPFPHLHLKSKHTYPTKNITYKSFQVSINLQKIWKKGCRLHNIH